MDESEMCDRLSQKAPLKLSIRTYSLRRLISDVGRPAGEPWPIFPTRTEHDQSELLLPSTAIDADAVGRVPATVPQLRFRGA
jgi:hypothetical protein